jgi:hypothetical protein
LKIPIVAASVAQAARPDETAGRPRQDSLGIFRVIELCRSCNPSIAQRLRIGSLPDNLA